MHGLLVISQRTIFGPPPNPLLSILMHLIFNTWIKWVMWPQAQRPTPQSVLAAALGPIACPSRSAQPRKARGPNLTLKRYTNLLKKMVIYKIDRKRGGGSKNVSLGRTRFISILQTIFKWYFDYSIKIIKIQIRLNQRSLYSQVNIYIIFKHI